MANTETMTIHNALAELKVLDKRITSAIDEAVYCRANERSNTKIAGKTLNEYQNQMKADLASIQTLIARCHAIRSAMIQSNAETHVKIAGEDYTVAQAIEFKSHGLELLIRLRDQMAYQYRQQRAVVETENGQKLRDAAQKFVQMYGEQKDANSEKLLGLMNSYMTDHTYDLLDPLDIKKCIDEMTKKIDAFRAEVDAALAVSNALTSITINYEVK